MERPLQQPYEQPSWQDITLEHVQDLIGNYRPQEALLAARIRRQGVLSAVNDIEKVLRADQNESGETKFEEWRLERSLLLEEVIELDRIIEKLSNQEKNE